MIIEEEISDIDDEININQWANVFLLKKILKKSRLPEDYSFLGYNIDKKMEVGKKYSIKEMGYIKVKSIGLAQKSD